MSAPALSRPPLAADHQDADHAAPGQHRAGDHRAGEHRASRQGAGQVGGELNGRLLPGLLPAAPFLPAGDLVVVDVETTGWLADAASITEIGAVRLSPGRPMAEFSALVNPGAPIPPDITALTGITDAMVGAAPPIAEVLPGFLSFAGGAVMVAHNAPFDVGFLTAACQDCGLDWPPHAVIDTAVLSRDLPASHDRQPGAGGSRPRAEPLRYRRSRGADSEGRGGGYGHRDSPDQDRYREHS